jgi:hypothetical protein
MTLRASAAARIRGFLDPFLLGQISLDFEAMVDGVLIAAVDAWHKSGFASFDLHEVNCTIQLYRHAQETKKNDPRWQAVLIVYEAQQPSPAMLAGLVSAELARRPDLTVYLGDQVKSRIECKRLGGAGHAQHYVADGMLRFISGVYYADPGYMVGYVQLGEPQASIDAVNQIVETDLGSAHTLRDAAPLTGVLTRLASSHANPPNDRSVRLTHYMVDMR